MSEITAIGSDTFHCVGCGSALKYKPGTTVLHCNYCGVDSAINVRKAETVRELDFQHYAQQFEELNTGTTKIIGCRKCGGESSFDESLKAMLCPYCNTPLIESDAHEERLIQPSYLLPFTISDCDMHKYLTKWMKGLWFAPNKLKKRALHSCQLQGVYFPCWTYDAQTNTTYSGERGDNYTVTTGSGKNRRTQTRTRWSSRSGRIALFFDDVMVPASKLVPSDVFHKLADWDINNLVEADKKFLSGFIAEKYISKFVDGFNIAKDTMKSAIDSAIRRDIGGDKQRIHSRDIRYSNIKFKLILLPVYISSYTYKNKLYHFFLNGRSGRVTGGRPYSAAKIALTSIVSAALITLLVLYFTNNL